MACNDYRTPYILRLMTIIMICAAPLFAQMMDPASSEQTNTAPSRDQLLKQFRDYETMKDPCHQGEDGGEAYRKLLQDLGYYDLLAECLESDGSPDDAVKWREIGIAWMNVGPKGVQAAFNAFDQALKDAPEDEESLCLKACLFHREGAYEQARQGYEDTLKINPNNVRAKLGEAVLKIREGDIKAASDEIHALGSDAQPYDVITRVMLRKALYDFEQQGGTYAETAGNHYAFSQLLYRAARFSDALNTAYTAAKMETDNIELWNFIGAVQWQLGDFEQAKSAYDQSLTIDPNQPDIQMSRDRLVQSMATQNQGR